MDKMSDPPVMMVSMREVERQIRGVRKILLEPMSDEDKLYNEGWRDALEYAYVVLNGHEYSKDENE